MSYDYFNPTRVLFGNGKLNELHSQALPGKKAMLVISDGKSAYDNGGLVRTQQQLELAGVEYALFDRIMPNPLKHVVMEGAAFARGHGCDFIVALGGGSVMDASKAIALATRNDGDLWDYVGVGTGKGIAPANAPLPIVAITTTAGTGSEADCCGVVTNSQTNEKIGIIHPGFFPVFAIVDPELMKTVSPEFTAYQGFDALFHSTEGYISNASNFMGDMIQRAAIENVGRYLVRAVRDGNDMEAREHMAFANTMSGCSMVASACTSEHSMEHAMSAYHQGLPHGAGLIMLSKAYYTYFIDRHACDERFVEMARMLGKANAKEPMDFIAALVGLQEACGVVGLKMSDYGIVPDEFDIMAKNARTAMGRLFDFDPCEMSHEDCVEIFRKSYR